MNTKVYKLAETDLTVTELPCHLAKLEIDIQNIFEKNLLKLLGIRFVASCEIIATYPKRKEVDLLGLDDNNYPVIIEIKRDKDSRITFQILSYWKNLDTHKGDFYLKVKKKLGIEVADAINWSTIRLISIAGNFCNGDIDVAHSVKQNMDLIKYKLYGDDIILIEPVYISSKKNYINLDIVKQDETTEKEIILAMRRQRLQNESWNHKSIFEHLLDYTENLGDDIEIKQVKAYVAAKRRWNFVSFQGLSDALRVSIVMTPDDFDEINNMLPTHIWGRIGSYKPSKYKNDHLQLDFNIGSMEDAEHTKMFIERSYQRS